MCAQPYMKKKDEHISIEFVIVMLANVSLFNSPKEKEKKKHPSILLLQNVTMPKFQLKQMDFNGLHSRTTEAV